MSLHAKNGTVHLPGGDMDYVCFGAGSRTLIMLPGLGDGLRGVKGTALPMALMYRAFARRYTVYMFSRRSNLPPHSTTRDMARDLMDAMSRLSIRRAEVVGVSMGGMIAQHLAIDYPDAVEKLALVVTSAEPNPLLQESIGEWLALAQRGDHTALMESNLRRIYSADYCRKNGWMIPFIGRLTKPKSYDRFRIQAQACLEHNALSALPQITCPTLVIGGEKDTALGPEPSRKMAALIPRASLLMYPGLGHGLYEEAKDFQQQLLAFLQQEA